MTHPWLIPDSKTCATWLLVCLDVAALHFSGSVSRSPFFESDPWHAWPDSPVTHEHVRHDSLYDSTWQNGTFWTVVVQPLVRVGPLTCMPWMTWMTWLIQDTWIYEYVTWLILRLVEQHSLYIDEFMYCICRCNADLRVARWVMSHMHMCHISQSRHIIHHSRHMYIWTCDMTHLATRKWDIYVYICAVWHDSFMCETWLIYMCDITQSETWLIHMCDITQSETWLIHMCDITQSETWLIYMCDITQSETWLIYMCDITQSDSSYDS